MPKIDTSDLDYPSRGDPAYDEKLRTWQQEYARRYRATPKDKAYRRKYKRCYRTTPAGRQHQRDATFKSQSGVTRAQADAMIKRQKGLCAICGKPARGKRGCARLQVDHDHRSGEIRAMLCANCNKGIGLLGDDPLILSAAACYLLRHKR